MSVATGVKGHVFVLGSFFLIPFCVFIISNRWSHIASPFVKRKGFGDGAFRPQYLSPLHATPETKWADSFQNLAKSGEGLAVSAKRKIFEDAGAPNEGGDSAAKVSKAKKEETLAPAAATKSSAKKNVAGPMSKFVLPADPDAVLAEVAWGVVFTASFFFFLKVFFPPRVLQSAPAPAPPKVSDETSAKKGFFASMEKQPKKKPDSKASDAVVKPGTPQKPKEASKASASSAPISHSAQGGSQSTTLPKEKETAKKAKKKAGKAAAKPLTPKKKARAEELSSSSSSNDEDDELALFDDGDDYGGGGVGLVDSPVKVVTPKKGPVQMHVEPVAIRSTSRRVKKEIERVDEHGYTIFEDVWVEEEIPVEMGVSPMKLKRDREAAAAPKAEVAASKKTQKSGDAEAPPRKEDATKEREEESTSAPKKKSISGGITNFFSKRPASK